MELLIVEDEDNYIDEDFGHVAKLKEFLELLIEKGEEGHFDELLIEGENSCLEVLGM